MLAREPTTGRHKGYGFIGERRGRAAPDVTFTAGNHKAEGADAVHRGHFAQTITEKFSFKK